MHTFIRLIPSVSIYSVNRHENERKTIQFGTSECKDSRMVTIGPIPCHLKVHLCLFHNWPKGHKDKTQHRTDCLDQKSLNVSLPC